MIALDDLDAQAREGWRTGQQLCRGCGGYHQVWGLLRASGVVGGTRVDQPVLAPLIADLAAPGQNILIAGAADAGLLQFMVEAAHARPLTIDIADRCPAPLALISEIAPPAAVAVRGFEADLTQFAAAAAYGLILSHSMLYFVPPEARGAVLSNLANALTPNGRLVLVLRLSEPVEAAALAAHDDAWLARARDKLAAVPNLTAFAGENLERVLADYARSRAVRLEAFSNPAQVEAALNAAGMVLDQHLVSGASTRLTMAGQVNAKQSHIFVARRL
jgi:SAM-dependent methyltransferase